ncbi:tripartite tricarboxylate transporter substrate binding protein [Bordetella sp. BOR01]|uniref:tripartite tricarboxylate transporter substrate binding protein n=1 Tax=Bordetella sp. BOR01 TaxID=2854779 RepID=UPI001C46D806|nr:tripartite tricarboxylate transporter substrate binding protein [Bordetella sp. BOR01]MBV7486499.1 tripartite tricarboxylate transporter substrate binding protein [Bordetella sp. BOR01]
MRRFRVLSGLLATFAVAACPLAFAQVYPDRPITLVVPFTAAGGTDLTARLYARALEKHAGQPVTVLNKPGAGGEIGMSYVARAEPDGYTLGIINTPNVLTIPIERQAQFGLDSFDLLANLVDDPATLSVHAGRDIRSIADLVEAARRDPDGLTYGTAGIGSAGHIAVLMFEKAAGIKLRHIPFKGTADVRTALIGGQIDVAAANLSEALAFAQGSPWRTLGVMKATRSATAAALPTFAEAGYALQGGSLRGVGAPAAMAAQRRQQVAALITKAASDPQFLEDARKAEQDVRVISGDEYGRALREQRTQFEALWKASPWNR